MFLNHFTHLTAIILFFFYSSENFILRLNEFCLASVFNLGNEYIENNEKLDENLFE